MPHHLYHYTRLLPNEVIRIQTEGLKPLSQELLALKIQAANVYGANLQTTDIRPNQWSLRQGQICFIARDFQDVVECRYSDSGYSDIRDLVSNWGGEIIHEPMRRAGREAVYTGINDASKAYVICVCLDGTDIDVYENFQGAPVSYEEIDRSCEYQVKQPIPPSALRLIEITVPNED